MKRLNCRDAGFNCDHVVQGQDDEDVMRKAKEHGAKQHGMKSITPEQEKSLRKLIQNT